MGHGEKKSGFNIILKSPYTLMGVLLLIWGSFAATSKLVLGGIDSFQLQFFMFGFAFITMSIILFLNGKIKGLSKIGIKDIGKLVLYSIPSYLYYFLYTLALSLKDVSTTEVAIINYLFPVFIVIFAIPINKEKINGLKLVSIILGFAGTLFIITGGNISTIKFSNITGDLLALGAAIAWGIFSNLGKRNKTDLFLSNYVYILIGFILSTLSLFIFSSFEIPKGNSLLGSLWLGGSTFLLSYYLWFKALKTSPSALIASLSFITPFVSLTFIAVLIGEKMTNKHLVGLAIIIAGIVVQKTGDLFYKRNNMKYNNVFHE